MEPELSIIILNWHSAQFLRGCLNSILSHPESRDWEVLVIDNASYDGSEDLLRRDFPTVRFIQAKQNGGFAAGNNLGYAHSVGRSLLFLNPDTEIVGTAIQDMLTCLRSTPSAGLVGPTLVNPDLSVQTHCSRRFPTLFRQCVGFAWVPREHRSGCCRLLRHRAADENRPVETEVVPGACVMVSRHVFEAAGKFNQQYFMYAEDIDLSYEVRKLGWTNYYIPGTAVIHYGGQSARRAPSGFSTLTMHESLWIYLAARRGRSYAVAYRCAAAVTAGIRVLLLGAGWVLVPRKREQLRDLSRKWVLVLLWAVTLTRANIPIPVKQQRGV